MTPYMYAKWGTLRKSSVDSTWRTLKHTVQPKNLAGIKFGGLASEAEN